MSRNIESHDSATPPGIRWWTRHNRRPHLTSFLLVLLVLLTVTSALCVAGLETFRLVDLLFGAAAMAVFTWFGFREFLLWLHSFRQQVQHCRTGVITGCHRELMPGRTVKRYRIAADVDGESVECTCLSQTYYCAQPGQKILVFSFGSNELHCVHPQMGDPSQLRTPF